VPTRGAAPVARRSGGMGRPSKCSPELLEEAVGLQRERRESITAVAKRLGVSPETLLNWVRRDEG